MSDRDLDTVGLGCSLVVVGLFFVASVAAFAYRPPPLKPRACDVLGVLVKVHADDRTLTLQNTTPYPVTVRAVRRTRGGEHGEDGWAPVNTLPLEPGETWTGETWPVHEVQVFGHPAIPAASGEPR